MMMYSCLTKLQEAVPPWKKSAAQKLAYPMKNWRPSLGALDSMKPRVTLILANSQILNMYGYFHPFTNEGMCDNYLVNPSTTSLKILALPSNQISPFKVKDNNK